MTSERSSSALRAARRSRSACAGALLAAAALAALAGCSVREEAADTQPEASGSVVAALDDSWPEFATLPRYHHTGVQLGAGRALVCGGVCRGGGACAGQDGTLVYLPTCELLESQGNLLTSTVFHLPGNPAGRLNATLTRVPTGGVLIAGGRQAGDGAIVPVDSAVASLPIADWLQAGDNPGLNWLSPETLNVAREQHTTTLLGTSVVAIGGFNVLDSVKTVGQIEVRTGAGATNASWTVFGSPQPILEPRLGHTATLLKPAGSEARVLILGGIDTARGYLPSGFIFSLEHGVQPITPMPAPGRYAHTATLLDDAHGSVLVVGGEGEDYMGAFGDAWRYDPVEDTWSPAGAGKGTRPVQRRNHGAVLLGGYVIVAGGSGPGSKLDSDGTALQSVQSYDWRQDSWSDLRPLSKGRAYLQLLKLSDTQIVASGGAISPGEFPETSELITLSPLGGPANDALGCASGQQADGVCCESACDGPCQGCDAAGVCKPLSGAPRSGHPSCGGNLCVSGVCATECDSTRLCADGFFCNAGQCTANSAKKAIGERCEATAECANDAPCVDKVCCQTACSGACESCSLGTGICHVLDKGQKPLASHPACGKDGDAQCAGRCDGIHGDRCSFPGPESTCSAASCENQNQSVRPASTCNGQGDCQASAAEQCGAYACDATAVGGAQCLSNCTRAEDCAPDARCDDSGNCTRCNEAKCGGFRCDRKADECKRSCQKSETDCVGGYYCHPLEHRCVEAVRIPVSALPACSMGVSRRGYHSIAIAVAAWLLSARRRRFRRTARGSLR